MGFKKIKILIFILPIFFLMIFCLTTNAQSPDTILGNACSDPSFASSHQDVCGSYENQTGSTETVNESTISSLAQRTLKFSIVLGAMLAVIMITVGGFIYITSAGSSANTAKAKDMITNALIGLMIVVGSYLILHTINPDLVNLHLKLPDIKITPKQPQPLGCTPEHCPDACKQICDEIAGSQWIASECKCITSESSPTHYVFKCDLESNKNQYSNCQINEASVCIQYGVSCDYFKVCFVCEKSEEHQIPETIPLQEGTITGNINAEDLDNYIVSCTDKESCERDCESGKWATAEPSYYQKIQGGNTNCANYTGLITCFCKR